MTRSHASARAAGVIEFDVYGKPAPQGSKKAYYNAKARRAFVVDDNPKRLTTWREDVKLAAFDATAERGHGFGKAPVVVSMVFYVTRPRAHFRTGKNANLLRDGAPKHPITKPDGDKLIRSTLDSLKDAGVYADDSCVVGIHATKAYADERPPGAHVKAWETT